MDLREAAQRILWHFKLLAICVVVGVLVPWALTRQSDPVFVATMRVLVTATPSDPAVSADTVAAIATSRSQVSAALRDIGADRDPEAFAKNISVRSVGASGMVDLTVTDRDRIVAAAAANAIMARTVQVMRASDLVKYPLPSVIDSASPATVDEITPTRTQDIAFGGLLGLVLGVVLAALSEAFSPTVIGNRAIAAELDAPVLGVLPSLKGTLAPLELPWLRHQLGAQAERSGVATIELTTAGPSLDLSPLTVALHQAAPTPRRLPPRRARRTSGATGAPTTVDASEDGNGNGSRKAELQIRVLDRTDRLSFHSSGSAGVVVVTPTVVKRADMDKARDLLGLTGWPAVGVIAYRRNLLSRALHRSNVADPSALPSRIRRLLPWRRSS